LPLEAQKSFSAGTPVSGTKLRSFVQNRSAQLC
jgi:hypothetical protein